MIGVNHLKKYIRFLCGLLVLLLLFQTSPVHAKENTATSDTESSDTELKEPEDNESDTDVDIGDDDIDDSEGPAPEDPHTIYTVSETADNKEIQKALNKAKKLKEGQSITVIVPAGTHVLTKRLLIFSNTTLHLEDGAIMEAHFTEASNTSNGTRGSMLYSAHVDENAKVCGLSACPHTDYNRTTNIVVEGGIWDRRSNIDSAHVTGIICLRYATNVTIRDMVLCNATEHLMNVSATKNTLIENVTFRDQVVYSNKNDYSFWTNYTVKERYAFCEALHVDYLQVNDETGKATSTYLGCENVIVRNCIFENVASGIGTHHKRNVTSQYISITGNTFTNVSGRCIGAYGYDNLNVSNNIYNLASSNKTSYFIYAYKGSGTITGNQVNGSRCFLRSASGVNYTVHSNTISNCGWHAMYMSGSTQFSITNNTVNGTVNSCFYLTNGSSATIQNNIGTSIGTHYIYAYNGSSLTVTQNQCISATKSFLTLGLHSYAIATGNTVSSVGTYGVNIAGTSKATVIENTISNAVLSGIVIYTTEKNSCIQNNKIENAGTYGIEIIQSGNKCQILGNTITNPGKSDIYIGQAKKYTLSGNYYYFTKGLLKYQVTKAEKKVAVVGVTDKKVESLKIPAKVTSGDYTYKVVQVGEKALRNCKKLKEVIIGKNVKHIKDKAFKGCNKLKFITLKCSDLKTVGWKAFGGAHKKVIVYMKVKKINKYTPLFGENAIRRSRRIKEL